MQSIGMNAEYINQIQLLAIAELSIASVVVVYVAVRYLYFYLPDFTLNTQS
jgi:exfoliative toxin A/B